MKEIETAKTTMDDRMTYPIAWQYNFVGGKHGEIKIHEREPLFTSILGEGLEILRAKFITHMDEIFAREFPEIAGFEVINGVASAASKSNTAKLVSYTFFVAQCNEICRQGWMTDELVYSEVYLFRTLYLHTRDAA